MTEQQKPEMIFKDKLILLENNILILGKVVTNMEQDRFIYVYEPMQLVTGQNGQKWMYEFMPESPDQYYSLPAEKILTIATPHNETVEYYNDLLMKHGQEKAKQKTNNETNKNLH